MTDQDWDNPDYEFANDRGMDYFPSAAVPTLSNAVGLSQKMPQVTTHEVYSWLFRHEPSEEAMRDLLSRGTWELAKLIKADQPLTDYRDYTEPTNHLEE